MLGKRSVRRSHAQPPPFVFGVSDSPVVVAVVVFVIVVAVVLFVLVLVGVVVKPVCKRVMSQLSPTSINGESTDLEGRFLFRLLPFPRVLPGLLLRPRNLRRLLVTAIGRGNDSADKLHVKSLQKSSNCLIWKCAEIHTRFRFPPSFQPINGLLGPEILKAKAKSKMALSLT